MKRSPLLPAEEQLPPKRARTARGAYLDQSFEIRERDMAGSYHPGPLQCGPIGIRKGEEEQQLQGDRLFLPRCCIDDVYAW